MQMTLILKSLITTVIDHYDFIDNHNTIFHKGNIKESEYERGD